MLLNIFKFYLLGLVIAFFVCLVIGAFGLDGVPYVVRTKLLRSVKVPSMMLL